MQLEKGGNPVANYIGIPRELKMTCQKISISGVWFNVPTAILTYIQGSQRLEFKLVFRRDRWTDSKKAAFSLMRTAVLDKKTLDIDFDDATKEILTTRLHGD